jgi:folate-binding protein YgfZ
MTILNLNNELIMLEISGADATTYLQGQLSNDIRELATKPFQFSAHLNNKGRILATFIITSPSENLYYLITSQTLAEKIIPRLKMFILRSKVNLVLSTKALSFSTTPQESIHSLQLAAEHFLIISAEPVNDSKIDSNAWHKILVELPFPMIYLDTQEKIIPQQVNFDLIGGINFKKGCYTGQEIVARTHYLGKIKRRMAKFTSQVAPQIGQSVVSPNLDNREVGVIIDFYHSDNLYRGLISLQNDCIDNVFLDESNHHQLHCLPLINETEGK